MLWQSVYQKPFHICFLGWNLQRYQGLSQNRALRVLAPPQKTAPSGEGPSSPSRGDPFWCLHLKTFPSERISLHWLAFLCCHLSPHPLGEREQLVTILCNYLSGNQAHLLLIFLIQTKISEAAEVLIEVSLPSIFQDEEADGLFTLCVGKADIRDLASWKVSVWILPIACDWRICCCFGFCVLTLHDYLVLLLECFVPSKSFSDCWVAGTSLFLGSWVLLSLATSHFISLPGLSSFCNNCFQNPGVTQFPICSNEQLYTGWNLATRFTLIILLFSNSGPHTGVGTWITGGLGQNTDEQTSSCLPIESEWSEKISSHRLLRKSCHLRFWRNQ